jgi:uncharacterized protein YggE
MPSFPFIVVNGSAETKVKPDEAKVSFSITEFNADPKKAELVVLQRGQEILALAKSLGIPKEQVTSSSYNKSTTRKKDDNYNSLEILGYEISQNFTVEINNIESYTRFADQLIAMKNVDSIRPGFDVSSRDEIKNQLIQQATNNAKKKALNLAAGMGVKLGVVFAVSQDFDFSGVNAIFAYSRGDVGMSPPDFVPPPSFDYAPATQDPVAIMFVPNFIEIRTSVSAIYRIK